MDLSKLTTQEKIQAFAEAKDKLKQIKELVSSIQGALYIDTQSLGFDTLGSKENGQVTVVYKKTYIYSQKTQEQLGAVDIQIDDMKVLKKNLQDADIEREEAKEEKEFSYIKYTKPKK